MAPRKRRVRSVPPPTPTPDSNNSLSARSPLSLHSARGEESNEPSSKSRRQHSLSHASDHAASFSTPGSSGSYSGALGTASGSNGSSAATSAGGSGSGSGTHSGASTAAGRLTSSPSPDVDPSDFPKISPSPPSKAMREVRDVAASLDGPTFSVASVALSLFDGLVDWAVRDVAIQFKAQSARLAAERRRSTSFGAGTQATASRAGSAQHASNNSNSHGSGKGGGYGSQLLYSDKNVTVVCSICSSNISASRYAQHVEKCLGRGGRMSSRAATAKLRANSEKEAAAENEAPVRRRRHGGADSESGSSHKRRKMSPVPTGSGGGGSQGTFHSRGGLPPSGRTRSPR